MLEALTALTNFSSTHKNLLELELIIINLSYSIMQSTIVPVRVIMDSWFFYCCYLLALLQLKGNK